MEKCVCFMEMSSVFHSQHLSVYAVQLDIYTQQLYHLAVIMTPS